MLVQMSSSPYYIIYIMTNKKHSHSPGGNMTNENSTTITLAPDPRGNYVTWAQGKKQVRALLKAHGYRAVGLFSPRKENKNEL